MENGVPKMLGDMPEIVGLVLRTSEAEIVDTWHTLGMRGTDSNDVAVGQVFLGVPPEFVLVAF